MQSWLTRPWFHNEISREDAVIQVTKDGNDSHGKFLIRKSDTRYGELVLTFSNQGAAKHLRMQITKSGCRIQHLLFDNVAQMIEFFQKNPLQLDSPALDNNTSCLSEVYLTEYIHRDITQNEHCNNVYTL